ncbi:tail fiber assembly protein [Rahnella sp. BIGb0603]|uniref:tail fiber assembly protein n=1 Tax=Rahnella sp. BIGb0603 TaxID=2940612 RepID=UPI002169D936|nr:tail fiber assembly protein [Rahnella sp. BIGb0603]
MMFRYSDKTQTIKVYDFSAITGELIGKSDAMIPPDTGLPARCTDIVPPQTEKGFVAVFTGEAWDVVADFRGKVVYSTQTGQQTTITELGALPENTTDIAPATRFDRWDGAAWVKDDAAERIQQVQEAEVQKKTLMQQAVLQIDTLQDAIDLDMASEDEKAQIVGWKKYRVLLNRLDANAAPDITWPEIPA